MIVTFEDQLIITQQHEEYVIDMFNHYDKYNRYCTESIARIKRRGMMKILGYY